MFRSPRLGRACLALALAAAAWAAVTALTGGLAFDLGRLRVTARDPVRPLLAAILLVVIGRVALGAAEFRRILSSVAATPRAVVGARVAAGAAACVLIVSIAWNTWAAGGSDSSCYVLQAEAFARARATLDRPLADVLPHAPPAAFAPAGFVPSPREPRNPVPICGPGLALAMVLPVAIARDAVFLVVPAFAALAVWLTFVLGRQLDDEVTGACAAVLLASSPIFLYQAVQPMSDVPAMALWLAALTLAPSRPAWAGVCASAAVLMRVNLAPIVLPLLLLLPDRGAWRRFLLAALPGLVLIAALNTRRYGSPFASGYGSTEALFSIGHVAPNLARYPRWLLATETPFVLLALVTPWWVRSRRRPVRLAAAAALSLLLLAATYLAYTVFDDWWYVRFLLPAIPAALVFSVAVALAPAPRARPAIAMGICLILVPWRIHVAGTRQVFDLQALESRFVLTGRYAAERWPAGAVALAVQQSASIRYHGRRATLAWDGIAPDALDATIETLRAAGRAPYIALEEFEEPRFRARFAGQRFGALDWPPAAQIRAPVRVRIYDPFSR